jgi:hypothetical protein
LPPRRSTAASILPCAWGANPDTLFDLDCPISQTREGNFVDKEI